jgi:hypothetical protein
VGSRRGRYAALVALGALALSFGCSTGAPPGFSGGDSWIIPLIGPLEDGPLLVPAFVNDKGPFVFAIDTDAHVSIIDEDVLAATKAHTGEGPRLLDESDTERNKFYAEILSWKLGPLTVQGPKPAQIVGRGTFDIDGRRVHGVIGRDIVADSLVWSIHRSDGIVVLATQKTFKAPAGWTPIKYTKLYGQIPNAETQPVARRLVNATINGQTFALHVDFGATTSQLRPRSWDRAKLVKGEADIGLVDEVGILRRSKQTGHAESVAVGAASTKDVVFVPYIDRRWLDQDIEGALGLGFFKPYDVIVNWDQDTIYLRPHDAKKLMTIGSRRGRWMSKTLDSCREVACVKVSAIDPLAGKAPEQLPPKHPGIVISIVRDPSMKEFDLEVLLGVVPAEGKPALKWLVANLPAGTDRAMTHLSPDYIGATFTVLDASPFPRPCPATGACVDALTPPYELAPTSADAPNEVAPPTSANASNEVAPTVIEGNRIAGEKSIPPDDLLRVEISQSGKGSHEIITSVRFCLDETGTPQDVALIKSSSYPAYDTKILDRIRTTWRYTPYQVNGVPTAVCTRITFIYSQK